MAATEKDLFLLLEETADYKTIVQSLYVHNSSILNTNTIIINDQTNRSAAAYLRDKNEQTDFKSTSNKQEFLGIVLYKEEIKTPSSRILNKIFIFVPGIHDIDFEDAPHPDLFDPTVTPSLDLKQYEYMAFYPASDSIFFSSPPNKKNIARVALAPNIFTAVDFNPMDNKYLGVVANASRLSVPPALPSTANSAAGASGAGSLGGAGNIPDGDKAQFLRAEFRSAGLTQLAPTFEIEESDLIDIPFQGSSDSFIITCLPNVRIRPNFNTVQGHYALDIGMPVGTPLVAAADMTIVPTPYQEKGCGWYIKGRTKKYYLLYCHLGEKNATKDPRTVAPNSLVKKGQILGTSGVSGNITGPHLHFQIQDLKGNLINPLYLLGPNVRRLLIDSRYAPQYDWFNEKAPYPYAKREGSKIFLEYPFISKKPQERNAVSLNTNEKAPIPQGATGQVNSSTGKPASKPTTKPKMLLVDFKADVANGVKSDSKLGSKIIKVREDVYNDLSKIKEILNTYNIAFTLKSQELSLTNKNISLFGRVGLQINLNFDAGLSFDMNPQTDDFLVGPNYNHPVGNGYKLNVYAPIRRTVNIPSELYKPFYSAVDIYNIRETYLKSPPKIVKIAKPMLNLTKIFEDFGFIQSFPKRQFFSNSDNLASNWYSFYKPSKILKGNSYKEVLETVYENNNEPIWSVADLIWDGNNFV